MGDSAISVALAAYGMSGRVFHAPLIAAHPGFILTKVVERKGSGEAVKRYPDVDSVRNFKEILSDKEIELVVVNTPEHTHYELTREALTAGKHVVVEKAFTTNSRDGKDLITFAQRCNRVLSVFQNSRWHGDFLTIKKIVDSKVLGPLSEVEIHYDRYRNFIQTDSWKEERLEGTGSLYNLGPHMIDQALMLFGWPNAVTADIRIQRAGGKVPDYFEVVLNYELMRVILKSSYLVREPGPRYTLHGMEGSFIKCGNDPQEALLKGGRSPLDDGWGLEPASQWGKLNASLGDLHFVGTVETLKGSYMGFYDNIFEAIRRNGELEVKPEQALDTIRIIEAAMESSRDRRTVSLI